MKIISVIAFVLISGCTRVDANPEPEHLSGVIKRYERIVDHEYGIVCHAEIYGRSISCVKVDEK